MEVYTIGVYNSSESEFFNKLIDNKIDVFIDIRRRRGVRGAKYSFVNSLKLQKKLADLGIKYIHLIELSPSHEIRQIQKKNDAINNDKKIERKNLSKDFINEYQEKVLNNFNPKNFVKNFKLCKIVFFCVEETPSACHRSLVTQKLNTELNIMTTDL